VSNREYPRHWEADVLLRDGRPCHLRPIRPDDADALRQFHGSLSAETIYFRFFAPYPELSDADVERFTVVDHDDRVAFVATRSGQIVGVGRYDRIDAVSAEVAFTVRDDFQGKGLGSVLLEHLTSAGRERGIERFVADVLPANQRMIGTFAEAGFRVQQQYEDGVIELHFDIAPNADEAAVMQAREHAFEARSIASLLNPSRVAVFGVSRRPESIGQLVVRNLLACGFTGSLCAVHPEVDEVAGIPAYRTVASAPGPIDLAVVTAPIDSVSEIVADCAAAGVRAMLVISSGFSELDADGPARVERLVAMARESGMRVIGPEAFGMINTAPSVQLNASLAETVPGRGRIGFFCESGTLGATIVEEMSERQLGLSTFFSPGMRVDVSGNDLLQYWEADESTSVVLLYLRSLGNPRKFVRIVRRLSRRKPVVAVLSSRSGEFDLDRTRHDLPEQVLDEVLAQVGVLQTDTIGGLLDAAALLDLQPRPAGERVALVSNSTALLLHTMDLVDRAGMSTVQRAFRVQWDAGGEQVGAQLRSALETDDVDAVIVIHVPPVRTDVTDVADVLREVAEDASKPIVAVLPHQTGLTGRSSLVSNPSPSGMPGPGSVPVYGEPSAAVSALSIAVRYTRWLDTPVGDEVAAEGVAQDRVSAIIESALADMPDESPTRSRGPSPLAVSAGADDDEVVADAYELTLPSLTGTRRLNDGEVQELLAGYGLELWPRFPVASEEAALRVAEEVGYPVVLKTTYAAMQHRTDLGGIRLNIENERALRTAYMSLMAQHPEEVWEEMVVQAMAPPGVSCTVVTREDPAFGPVLGFAIGGYVSNLTAEWAFRMLPMTDTDAAELIRQPRTSPLLFGFQGAEPLNTDAVEAVVLRVAKMVEDWPQLHRIELNPLLATTSGCYLLGASVEISQASVRDERRPRRLT
jgi:acyl-CoA synthetase (NDP forming)/RimJ/RimL family protein N-acetyltransferase